MLEAALEYAALGWPVAPLHGINARLECTCGSQVCSSPGKHPLTSHGLKDATTDAVQITDWFTTYNFANIAIVLGARAGVFAVDVDPRNEGHIHLRELEALHGDLPATLTADTGGGGSHHFFQLPPETVFRKELCKGVDLKGEGGYVVAPPSRHVSGKTYAWREPLESVAEAPEWLLEKARRKKNAPSAKPGKSRAWGEGERNEKLCSLAGALRHRGVDEETIRVSLRSANKQRCVPPLLDTEVDGIASGILRYPEPTTIALRAQEEGNEWMLQLSLTQKGALKRTARNIDLILRHHPAWRGVLGFNVRKQAPVFLKQPPFADGKPGPMQDSDIHHTAVWIEKEFDTPPGSQACTEALFALARCNSFDPVQLYLEALEWDGESRIDTWLRDYCGVVGAIGCRQGAKWLISAVARAFEPGCKADHMLLLIGKQGAGKSRTLKILGGEWFCDSISRFSSEDKAAKEQLQGPWIVELPELSAMGNSEVEAVKAFATSQVDNFRASYGRLAQDHPRRCVFGGSTNDHDALKDLTGNRRFWPVVVGRVDQAGLEAARDQLWAEAGVRWLAGEKLYLSEEEERAAAAVQQEHTREDSYEDLVVDYVQNKTVTTTTAVCLRGVKLRPESLSSNLFRIGRLLRRLGWRQDQQRDPTRANKSTRIFIAPGVDLKDIRWSDIEHELTTSSGPRLTAIPGGRVKP